MAKEKLFTPEDFDKDPKSSRKNIVRWIVGAILVIIVIIVIIFALKGCDSKTDSNPIEEITLTTGIERESITDRTKGEDGMDNKENGERVSDVSTNSETERDAQQELTTTPGQSSEQSSTSESLDVESEAIKVIRGEYGNNPVRKKALGDKYQSIQNRVNQLKRQGVF